MHSPSARCIELLEPRIAPAMATLQIVSPHVATFTDTDGDHVTVKITNGTLTPQFFIGTPSGGGDQWQVLDFTLGGFEKTDLTVTVAKVPGGDGLTSLGYLNSTAHSLGKVSIQGDLGKIDAGLKANEEIVTAITSLTVESIAKFGISTQVANGSIIGTVFGTLGSLHVKGDMQGDLNVHHGIGSIFIGGSLKASALDESGVIKCTDDNQLPGNIGKVSILGSVIGGAAGESGYLLATGDLGAVLVGHDVLGGSSNAGTGVIFGGGKVASLTVNGSVIGSTGGVGGLIDLFEVTGAVKIGSLVGGSAADTGKLTVQRNAPSVTIAHDVRGGTAGDSGRIFALSAGTIKIGGSLVAGLGALDGAVQVQNSLGSLTISGDLVGGPVSNAGMILAGVATSNPPVVATVGSIKIGGSIIGNGNGIDVHGFVESVSVGGSAQGCVIAASSRLTSVSVGSIIVDSSIHSDGDIGSLKVGGSFAATDLSANGGLGSVTISGNVSGKITAAGRIGSVQIGGDLDATYNGRGYIESTGGSIGKVRIDGSVRNHAFLIDDSIKARGTIDSVIIGHDFAGSIVTDVGDLTSLKIGGSLDGAFSPGRIHIAGALGSATVLGSVIGGQQQDPETGEILANHIGSLTIAHDLIGGRETDTGYVHSNTGIGSVMIGGSLIGGDMDSLSPQTLNENAGGISSGGDIGSIRLGHDLIGGSLTADHKVLDGSGFIHADGRIGQVFIGGSILAGYDFGDPGNSALRDTASIRAGDDIGSLTVKGSLVGHFRVPILISARGQKTPTTADVAIGKIDIGGSVLFASIDAGYSTLLAAVNGDAQIGAVTVGGSWEQSNLLAGVSNSASGNSKFGDANDAAIFNSRGDLFSKIASVTIRGSVHGTAAAGDHYGFSAQEIGALKIGGVAFKLQTGRNNDIVELAHGTNDITAREVA